MARRQSQCILLYLQVATEVAAATVAPAAVMQSLLRPASLAVGTLAPALPPLNPPSLDLAHLGGVVQEPAVLVGFRPSAPSAGSTSPCGASAQEPSGAAAGPAPPGRLAAGAAAQSGGGPATLGEILRMAARAAADAAVQEVQQRVAGAASQQQQQQQQQGRRRKRRIVLVQEGECDEEDMEQVQEQARAMDLAVGTGAQAHAATQREVQQGYNRRSAARTAFLGMPQKLNRKPGCELVNFVAVTLDPKGNLSLESRCAPSHLRLRCCEWHVLIQGYLAADSTCY